MFRMMSRILACNSISEVAQVLYKYDFYDMIIALNNDCLDPTINPLSPRTSKQPFDDEMKLICNTDLPTNGKILPLRLSELHPNLEETLYTFDSPLLFFSLNYMGIPMGYVCFNYHNYDIQNYYKASQIINTLNSSFGAFRTVQHQHYLNEKIEEMYRCDGLTHLLNRMALKNSYPDLRAKCSDSMTLVLADLDGLKHINDCYGHDDGDFAICAVAEALRSVCPEDALCIRWGGDEMVAVIPHGIPENKLRKAFQEYLDRLNAVAQKEYRISASVGAKTFAISETSDFEEMVRATDQLMYYEKNRKKLLREQITAASATD